MTPEEEGLNPFVFRAFDNRAMTSKNVAARGLNPFVFRAFDNPVIAALTARKGVLIPLFSGHSIITEKVDKVVWSGVLIPLFSGHSIIRDRRFNVSAQ